VGHSWLFLGLLRGLGKAFGLVGDICVSCSSLCVQVLARSTFFLPGIPLPLFEMGETINAKQRDWAVILVGVMGVKVDSNVPIKVTNGRRRVERLEDELLF
jgi:hypothetical protein